MLKKLHFTRIRNKLATAFLLQIVAIVSLVILFSYYSSREIIKKNSIQLNDSLIENGITNLEAELSSIQQVVYSLFNKEDFVESIPLSSAGDDTVYDAFNKIGTSMMETLVSKSNILSIVFIDNSGNLVYSIDNKASYQRNFDLRNAPQWMEDAMKTLQNNKFDYALIPTHKHLSIQNDFSVIDDMVYTYACTALDVNHGYKPLGILMISFKLSKIAQICENVNPYDSSFTYVVGDDGTIVYDSAGAAIGDMLRADILEKIRTSDNYGTVFIDEKEYVVVSEQSVEAGWSIVSLVPVSEYAKDINTITKYIVLIAILATGVSIFITYLLSKQFSKPIENLSRVMNHIEDGNLDLRAEEKGSDEISLLSRNFNSLISRLKFVMKHEYELTIRQKDAELKALQAQINPHFLFNSLQSVNSIAAVYQISEINTIVDSLGKILRYSIKTKDNIVSMREEVEHATHYLNIYKVRFGERIKYQIQIPDELMQYSILKLTLQPIVENAIIHGFRNNESIWYIMITASIQNEVITIDISDNGIGMSSGELQALRENLESSDSGFYSSEYPSIGLKNVYHRMKISYGDSAKIEIDSDLNVGTSVKIHYPAMLYQEVENNDTNTDR